MIHSVEVDCFFLGDEWADTPPEAWTEVIRPMLSTCEGHALFIGTPKGKDHFYDLYLKGQHGETHRGFLTLEAISGHFVEFSHPTGARSGILTIFCFWRRVL
ncbi:hypothetical protein, partial [Acetobacter sicerae]